MNHAEAAELISFYACVARVQKKERERTNTDNCKDDQLLAREILRGISCVAALLILNNGCWDRHEFINE
jgi:hypothetical protein